MLTSSVNKYNLGQNLTSSQSNKGTSFKGAFRYYGKYNVMPKNVEEFQFAIHNSLAKYCGKVIDDKMTIVEDEHRFGSHSILISVADKLDSTIKDIFKNSKMDYYYRKYKDYKYGHVPNINDGMELIKIK